MIYILKWNPEKSNVAFRDWESWIEHFPFIHTAWPVNNHEAYLGDERFFIVKVGKHGRTGLVASGHFLSTPYCGNIDFSNDCYIYTRDLDFYHIVHPERDPIITIEELQDNIPGFDWDESTPDGWLAPEDEIIMDRLWRQYIKKYSAQLKAINKNSDYIIEPSVLTYVVNSSLWQNKVRPNYSVEKVYCFDEFGDCRNMSFFRDYEKNEFHLSVLFNDIVLKLVCRDISEIKMQINAILPFAGDFCLSEGNPEKLYLRSNGIEIWCDSIEFVGTETHIEEQIKWERPENDDDEFPF